MTTDTQHLLDTRATPNQRATVDRMLAAPAGNWKVTKILGGHLLGVELEGVAVQIESPTLKVWGVILPNGSFIKPQPGRRTIDKLDIAIHL